jgi:hypothetical protein
MSWETSAVQTSKLFLLAAVILRLHEEMNGIPFQVPGTPVFLKEFPNGGHWLTIPIEAVHA